MADLVLYDGVCGLCNSFVQFVLKHDTRGRFLFASLQSPLADEVLAPYGKDPGDLNTVYVIADYRGPDEHLLEKGEAAVFVLDGLKGIWSLARPLGLLPRSMLDGGYDWVARRRYRWFGRTESCLVPSQEQRARFVDF